MKHVLGALLGAATLLVSVPSIAQTTLKIATVNNGDNTGDHPLTQGVHGAMPRCTDAGGARRS